MSGCVIGYLKLWLNAAPKLTSRLPTFASYHIKVTKIAMYLQSWNMQCHFERRTSEEESCLLAVVPSNQLLGSPILRHQ